MTSIRVSPLARWCWRGVLLVTLVLAVAWTSTVRAETGVSTITLYAPGAPAGAWVSVQWQNRAGTWRDVEGWQSPVEVAADSDLAFVQLAVFPKDYGRGPFRWVVYEQQGGAAWATSPSFFLPDGDGAALAMTLTRKSAAASTGAAGGEWPAGFGFATITLEAPDAPAGGWVGVQWLDRFGTWHDVEGWQGPLDVSESTGLPLKQWGVYSKDYGRGPFRWIVYTEQGGAVLATSPRFFLPQGDGANLATTLLPKIAVAPADTLTAEVGTEPAQLSAETSTRNLQCSGGLCDFSIISVEVPDMPAGSKVGVQWQDGEGTWHDVRSWQGSLGVGDNGGAPSKQWAFASDLQGRGPFRWVIYNPLGDTVIGVSPGFMLPERDGVDLNVSLSR